MTETEHPVDAIQRELREMRDKVATFACQDKEQLSYKAHLTLARSLRTMQEKIQGLQADVTARALRGGLSDNARIEEECLSSLGDWLTEYAREAETSLMASREDKDIEKSDRRGWLPFAVSPADKIRIYALYAERHHDMIFDFCIRHAETVRERANEIETELMENWSRQMSRSPSP